MNLHHLLFLAISKCASSPCHNGTCVDGDNKYTCICNRGFTGTNCDQGEKSDLTLQCKWLRINSNNLLTNHPVIYISLILYRHKF